MNLRNEWKLPRVGSRIEDEVRKGNEGGMRVPGTKKCETVVHAGT